MKTDINQYSIEGRKANEFLTILDELGIMYYKIRERDFYTDVTVVGESTTITQIIESIN